MSEPPSSKGRQATLNLSIGPSCFVKCEGCYNHFGATASKGNLVSRREVSRLVRIAGRLGYRQVTVAGGDPLTHPEILDILRDLRDADMFVKLDTVGSALLRSAPEAFYGRRTVDHSVDPAILFDLVDVLGLPLDGSNASIQRQFREPPPLQHELEPEEDLFGNGVIRTDTRRHDVAADTIAILDMAAGHRVETCVNTVVHAGNVLDLPVIAKVLLDHQPDSWQIFEFQATGRLASRNASRYSLTVHSDTVALGSRAPVGHLLRVPGQSFTSAVRKAARAVDGAFPVAAKRASAREEGYLLVNDAGDLWIPGTRARPLARVIGNIRDPEVDLVRCLADFAERASAG